jgi:hypothetical protein
MGLLAEAAAILGARRLGADSMTSTSRGPQAVALHRRPDRGAVLFLLRRTTSDWLAIIALLERRDSSWDEVALVHKPWWDPADTLEDGELMLIGGQSRFATGASGGVVLIPGQAAPDVSVARTDGRHGAAIHVHPCRGHLIYLGALDHVDETVTLTARRAGIEQAADFERIGNS